MTDKKQIYVCKCEEATCKVSFEAWVKARLKPCDCPVFENSKSMKEPNWKRKR